MVKKYDLYMNGRFQKGKQYVSLYSPYSKQLLGEVAYATEEETKLAIVYAVEASKLMAKLPAYQRAAILEKVAILLQENAAHCARLIALEAAKPIHAARAEVERTITTYKFAAEEAKRITGETIIMDAAPGGEDRIAFTIREPVGVIAAITPFNFPMNLVAHKVGPAIAAGNAIIVKPAEQTPLSALFLAELFEKADLPAGALTVLPGYGQLVGATLVGDSRISAVTFTGSPSVGKEIKAKAGLKKVTLELGSNSALLVDDGVDVEAIVSRAVFGAFVNSGQVCISVQRIYVHEAIFTRFLELFIQKTKELSCGDPLKEETFVSALIRPEQVTKALQWIKEAQEKGATLLTGGEHHGGVLSPTVLTNVSSDTKLSCQEVFAPVVFINKITSIEEAVALVNATSYGLQAGIYTNQLQTAFSAAEKLEVGGVMINDIPTFRVDQMPYGGVKESGFGREGIKYAIEEMTEMKLICIKKSVN